MEPKALQPTQKWYKTKGGISALVILGILGTFVALFLMMTGYYLWIAAYGDNDVQQSLQERFGQTFTDASGASIIGARSESAVPAAELVRPHNARFGNPDAAVTIVAFIDFECPFCRQSYTTFETIRERYEPAVNVVFKHFPLESIHPRAGKAALAAHCAQKQNNFWPFYQRLFSREVLSDAALLGYAQEIGLNISTFERCLQNERMLQEINEDIEDGLRAEVRGTPTYIINSVKLEGVAAETDWNSTLLEALQSP